MTTPSTSPLTGPSSGHGEALQKNLADSGSDGGAAIGVPPDLSDTVRDLTELFHSQRDIYRQLKTLSDQQGELIHSGSSQQLLNVLARRQKLVDDLALINQRLGPYRKRWQQVWQELGEQDQSRIGALIREVEGLLADIIDQDNLDHQRLEQSKNSVHGELGRISQGGAALKAYKVNPSFNGGNFTDRQG